jgi:callose synthase
MKKVMQNDAARTEDVIAYNIIPLDALSTTTNAIVNFPEVIVYGIAFCFCWFS